MKVKELLNSPDKWIQGSFGQNAQGESVGSLGDDVVCWCLAGAVNKCYYENATSGQWSEIMGKIQNEVGNVVKYNDDPRRTFEDIRALIEKLDI